MKTSPKLIRSITLIIGAIIFPALVFASSLGNFMEEYSKRLDLPGHWAADYVGYFMDNGIVSTPSFKGGSFNPDDAVNRAEFLKMLLLAGNVDTSEVGLSEFSDVKNSDWHKDYVMAASELGIVSGYGDGTFHPENYITRAEALKMIMEVQGIPVTDHSTTIYSDVEGWQIPYVETHRNLSINIIRSHGEIFQPNTFLTRAEAVKAIFRGVSALDTYTDQNYLAHEGEEGNYRFMKIESNNYVPFTDEDPGLKIDWLDTDEDDFKVVEVYAFSKHVKGDNNLYGQLSSSDGDYVALGESGHIVVDLGRNMFGPTTFENVSLSLNTGMYDSENIYLYGDHYRVLLAESPQGPWSVFHEADVTNSGSRSTDWSFGQSFHTEDKLYDVGFN
jgi:hypothetical protein